MNTKIVLGSIAMDLKRVALGSGEVGKIFLAEAVNRKREITQEVPDYIKKILDRIEKTKDKEDFLMYSTLLQNYCIKNG